jgi:hypothetical protein
MVKFIKTWLNPVCWFDWIVIKPLMLLLSAIFWVPLVTLKWGYRKSMQAWNSKLVCYLKPKSLIGKWIVYPPLIWCAMPLTNTWLAAYLMYKYDVSWDDVWSWPAGLWNMALDLGGIVWDLIPMGWAAVQYFL